LDIESRVFVRKLHQFTMDAILLQALNLRLEDIHHFLFEASEVFPHPGVLHDLHPRFRVQVLQIALEHLLVLLLESCELLRRLTGGQLQLLHFGHSSLSFLFGKT
jgi:hypothetical protein